MSDRSKLRLFVLQVLVVSILATLMGRLWFLQVYKGADYVEAATANRVRPVLTPAPRGEVYDITGAPLVQNRTALVISVNRSLLVREPKDGYPVLQRLSKVLRTTPVDLQKRITPCGSRLPDKTIAGSADNCWSGSPYQPVPVAEYDAMDNAAVERVLAVEEHREDFPAVSADFRAVREYPGATLAAHTLGYLGPISQAEVGKAPYQNVQASALIGRDGIEKTYDAALRGTDGIEKLLVDKDGSVTGTASTTPPVAGDKLVLSLHAGVQKLVEDELEAAILRARTQQARQGKGLLKADSGAVVVLEAKTGRIVALASYPSYDPSAFVGGISSVNFKALIDKNNGEPLVPRSIAGAYAPASTFKAISSLAAVQNGQSSFASEVPCPGVFAPTGQTNFETANLGALSLRTAIVKSCDTNFYKFAYDAWVRDGGLHPVERPKDPMITLAKAFGLGQRTGIDLPNESKGLVPDRQWRQSFWDERKVDYCLGAKNPSFTPERRAFDLDFCNDGYLFRGGQATNFSIGQGETTLTPLQLASVYSTIANGGTIMQPTVGRALLSADGTKVTDIPTKVKGRIPVNPQTIADLRDALHGVTSEEGGTGFNAFQGLGLAVAGKTGTGEVGIKQDTSVFASFAPVEDPQLVVVSMISQGGTGASTSAPLVRKIYAGIFGLDGKTAILPGGKLPAVLPKVRSDGTVARAAVGASARRSTLGLTSLARDLFLSDVPRRRATASTR